MKTKKLIFVIIKTIHKEKKLTKLIIGAYLSTEIMKIIHDVITQ